MRAAVLMTVLATASLVFAAQDDKAKKELNKLSGTWVAQSREYEGKVEAKAELKGMTLVITGDKFVVKDGSGRVQLKGTLRVDPAATPKAIDVKVTDKDGKEMVYPTIYELDGDTLKTAVSQSGGVRPKEFTTRAGSPVRVTIYKRSGK